MSETHGARPAALLITPVLPMPGGSGRALRAWDWLTELSRDHDVHVLLCAVPPISQPIPCDYPASVHQFSDALSPSRGIGRRLGILMPLLALISRKVVTDWIAPASRFASRLHELEHHVARLKIARVVVFRLYLWDVGRAVASRVGSAVDLDIDDVESSTRLSIARACWRIGRRIDALYYLSTALQYWLVERSVPTHCRMLWVSASEDIALVPPRFASVACRPNRLPLPNVLPSHPHPSRLLFVGTLNYPPNEEAVRFLVDALLPALQARRRSGASNEAINWRLTIVGRHPSPSLDAVLRGRSDLDYVADADDLAPLYAEAAVVLVPLWAGGGTKLKTLEAFAHGRPVISTFHGARGLGAEAGTHFLRAENVEEFLAGICALDRDRGLAARIAAAAQELCRRVAASPNVRTTERGLPVNDRRSIGCSKVVSG